MKKPYFGKHMETHNITRMQYALKTNHGPIARVGDESYNVKLKNCSKTKGVGTWQLASKMVRNWEMG